MKPIIGFYGFWVYLTYLSLISAVVGIYFAVQGQIKYALICLLVSGLCDTFDGKIASLKERTEREEGYGIQLDALADVVAFGVLPAVIGFVIGQKTGEVGVISIIIFSLYVLAALIRLAYFTVLEVETQGKEEKRTYYEGLPVTIVALIIPVVYAVCTIFDLPLFLIYNVLLAIIALAFVLRIKIYKPNTLMKVVLCLIGVPILILIIVNGVI